MPPIDINNLPKVLQPYQANIQKTIKPVIDIKLSQADNLPIWASKVGGHPYLSLTHDYPHDSNGLPLQLLAQINLSDVPTNDLLPRTGMLLFFIGGDDLYGMDFDDQQTQDGFRVLYFDTVITDESQLWQDFSQIDAKMRAQDYYSPIDHEKPSLAMSFDATTREMSYNDFEFEQNVLEGKDFWRDVTHDDEDLAEDILEHENIFDGSGHHLLGYPVFTQEDPRSADNALKDFILLFQLDTDNIGDYSIMWGDSGVGNFFIHHEDLKNKDFSKVLYNWDCC